MHTAAAWKERVRVDSVFALADEVPRENAELRSHLARYLCVLVSGYVEVAVAAILEQYAMNRGDGRLRGYVASQLEWFTNPNGEKLASLLATFDGAWRESYYDGVSEEQDGAFTSVHAIRNLVAHGRSTDVTMMRAHTYAAAVFSIVELVDRICHEAPRV
jgi:hypothetical protein